jgi:dipeptidase E
MKKILLASIARNVIDKYIALNNLIPQKYKLAFIPTAANHMESKDFIFEDRKKFVDIGFNVKNIDIEGMTKHELLNELSDIDIILVAGGNTFLLLQEMKKSGFDIIIKNFLKRGGIYIGSSAGSLVAGLSIELAVDIDDQNDAPELKSYKALSLVNFVPLPHYNDPEFKNLIDKNISKINTSSYKIIKLEDNQAISIEGEIQSIITG